MSSLMEGDIDGARAHFAAMEKIFEEMMLCRWMQAVHRSRNYGPHQIGHDRRLDDVKREEVSERRRG